MDNLESEWPAFPGERTGPFIPRENVDGPAVLRNRIGLRLVRVALRRPWYDDDARRGRRGSALTVL